MSTIEEQLKALREETLAALKQISAENKKEMQELRVSVLGKKGSLTEILKGMKDVSAEMRPIIGKHVNEARDVLTAAFEERIAALEGGVGALATASGMAAVTYTILALAHVGDHVVAASTIYGGTFNLLKETLPRYGITTTFVDVDNLDEVEAANLAGKLAKENNNHVYLTTGSKTMHIFAKSEALQDCEVWTRILPTAEVLQMMEDLNVSPKRIIAVQGPFSYDMNRIMFHDTKASVVVMKNSGLVGGADTKLQAAMDLGIHVIVIDRPRVKLESHVVSTNDEFFKLWEDTNGLR